MNIRLIRTQADYDRALTEVEACFDAEPEPCTLKSDCFLVLTERISADEAKYGAINARDPVGALTSVMETQESKQADLLIRPYHVG